ncbi:CPBP family intramembrane metalloprotease [Candidatus Woesearchaeota archaeon]|nr:CPBP family intramembrane metalloprotease [Candidatus Woesearchaeota archaeon]
MRTPHPKFKHMEIMHFIELLVVLFLFQVGLSKISKYYFQKFSLFFTGNFDYLNYYAFTALATILLVLIIKFLSKRKFSDLGFKIPVSNDWRKLYYAFALLFFVAFVSQLVDRKFDIIYAETYHLRTMGAVIATIFLMPFQVIYEEFFERSMIQSQIARFFNNKITILIVSVNFAFLHFAVFGNNYHTITNLVFVFLGSLILAGLFQSTRNVWMTLILHVVYNCIVIFQIFFHYQGYTAGVTHIFEIIFFGIWGILFILALRPVWRYFKSTLKDRHHRKLTLVDWAFITLFSVVFPIMFYYYL